MPISKQEFGNGKLHSGVEQEITTFLKERKDRAFTSQEIMEGINYHTEFSTPEISKISTFAVADFTAYLNHLVYVNRISMKIVRGRMYFTAVIIEAHCPKCRRAITEPRKTWKMAGRPDRNNQRLQLHIGLFDCPVHGAFRKVLGKKKIPAGKVVRPKKKPRKKRKQRKKKQVRKKRTPVKKRPTRRRKATTTRRKKKSKETSEALVLF